MKKRHRARELEAGPSTIRIQFHHFYFPLHNPARDALYKNSSIHHHLLPPPNISQRQIATNKQPPALPSSIASWLIMQFHLTLHPTPPLHTIRHLSIRPHSPPLPTPPRTSTPASPSTITPPQHPLNHPRPCSLGHTHNQSPQLIFPGPLPLHIPLTTRMLSILHLKLELEHILPGHHAHKSPAVFNQHHARTDLDEHFHDGLEWEPRVNGKWGRIDETHKVEG